VNGEEEKLDELIERLPERVQEVFDIAENSPRYQSRNRTPTLSWLAQRCAEHGLTDGEIVQVIQYRNTLWGRQMKYGGALYQQYRMYLRLVDLARENYPKLPGMGIHDDFTEESL
jgi:hypothetical protein